MRLRRLALKGITRFDQAEVDFEDLGPGLVAIAGANGAGKTTILEAPFAALFGEFPTRPGSFYAVAHGKDARLELEVENGQPYRALVAIDAVRQTSEAYLFNGDGAPLTSGKVREYASAIEQRFGSPRLMLSAALSCQSKRGSFLDLSKAERKDLLAEILDTAGLQALAEAARAKAKAAELALERIRGQVAAAEQELSGLEADHIDVQALAGERVIAEQEFGAAQSALEDARARYAELQAELARAGEQSRAVHRLRMDRDEAMRAVAKVTADRVALDAELERTLGIIERNVLEARAAAERLSVYEAAERQLASTREVRSETQRTVQVLEAEARQARGALLAKHKESGTAAGIRAKLETARRQSELLDLVPCAASATWERLDTATDEIIACNLSRTCPLLASARSARDDVAGLQEQLAAITAREGELVALQADVDAAEGRLEGARGALAEIERRLRDLEPTAAEAARARAASQRLEDLARQRADAEAAHIRRKADLNAEQARQEARRAALQAEVEATPLPDTEALDRSLCEAGAQGKALRTQVDELQARLRKLDRAIAKAEEAAARREALRARLDGDCDTETQTARDLGEWTLLERALGRDGIQALEIDAAGPELSSLTNELLGACFGPRFEVRFITQAPKATGKGAMKEVFDVQVADHDRGREGAVDSLSGGEKTIVSEAISLALAIYVGRHSGRRFETLFRDETAGQLDPDNAQRYVAMLRRARVMAGAHQVVFIAQQPEVWQQADAVLYLRDGRVEIRQ